MGFGFLKPVAAINGLPDSGHGLCIPPTVHSTESCGAIPRTRSIRIKEYTCWWPPLSLLPLTPLAPNRATVLVNGFPIMLAGDKFIVHPSACTNIVIHMCPCGKSLCPKPTPYPCSVLTTEDRGVGHDRTLYPTTLTVFALKRLIARQLDPLGVGFPGFSYPCSSVVAYGSMNVWAG